MDDYFDIEFDWDDTIFKVEEFYWYINQVDGNFMWKPFFLE